MGTEWIRALTRNSHGRPVLSEAAARRIARLGADAGHWYVAPFSTRWTIGKIGDERFACLHILDRRGEPLGFFSEDEACRYLRLRLKVPEEAIVHFGRGNPLHEARSLPRR